MKKNSEKVRKVEQFYEKVKKFTECYSINGRIFLVSIMMVMVMCLIIGFIYFQYGGLNKMFDYLEQHCECMTEKIEENQLQIQDIYNRIEIVIERTVEMTIVMTIATMISIFLTFTLMQIIKLIAFLIMKIVLLFSKKS